MTAAAVRYLVFSDVDGTLIGCQSMVDFFHFYFRDHKGPSCAVRYRSEAARLVALFNSGASVEAFNREYFRAYSGERVTEVVNAGRAWYHAGSARGGFYIAATLDALVAHRREGAAVVLVSGSFAPLLAPICRALGAAHLLCTELVVDAGRYTGAVALPMLGAQKATAVRALLGRYPHVDPRACFAYGDHASDAEMLGCVGQPVVVGNDPGLRAWLETSR